MTKRILPLLSFALPILYAGPATGQCSNPVAQIPDGSRPVNGDPEGAYCVSFTFDPDITGFPSGLAGNLLPFCYR